MANKVFTVAAAVLASSVMASQAAAVIVTGTDGTRNTTADTGAFADAFSLVGYYNDRVGSVVYLGDGVIITAAHVTPNSTGSVTIAGNSYNVVSNSRTQLHHPTNTSTFSDLVLLQIDVSSGGPAGSAVFGATAIGSTVRLAGHGYNRQESPTTWYVDTAPSPTPWIWSESDFSGADSEFEGYKANTSGHTIRWGTNSITGTFTNDPATVNFATTFNINGLADEAQAVTGDSGGGVFQQNGSTWELVGIMYGVVPWPNQPGLPGRTAVDGNLTLFADINAYKPQINAYINALVPEPGTLSLLVAAGCLALRRRRVA